MSRPQKSCIYKASFVFSNYYLCSVYLSENENFRVKQAKKTYSVG